MNRIRRRIRRTTGCLGTILILNVVVDAQTQPVPPLSNTAIARCAADLALSDAQLQVLWPLVREYQETFAEGNATAAAERKRWTQEFHLSIMPELDESVDISQLPRQEQREIDRNRAMMRRGGRPMIQYTTEQLKRLNDYAYEAGLELQANERRRRERVLVALREMLGSGQEERWPQAMRRLDINILDQNPDNTYSVDDPRKRVDMLAVITRASEEDAKLHPLADALRTPERILAYAQGGKQMIELAGAEQAFEIGYRDALTEFRRRREEMNYQYITLFNSGDMEGAARLEQLQLDARRRVWNLRRRFVDDMAQFARTMIDEGAARAWIRRCHEQFCPVLFLEDSTDMLYGKIHALEGVEQEQLEAMENLYLQHCAWREEFLPRVVRLEIAERCHKLWADPEDERDSSKRLLDAHDQRRAHAERINLQFRGLLPSEHQDAFDAWRAAWREEQAKYPYPPTINVRP